MAPMRKVTINIVLGVFAFSIFIGVMGKQTVVYADSDTALPVLIINEVQTTGLSESVAEDGAKEFVEIYNPSSVPLDAKGWRVEYLSASHNGGGAPTRVLGELDFVIGGASYILLSYAAYLPGADKYFGTSTSSTGWIAKSGGHIRIVNPAGQTVDAVNWGSASPLQIEPPTVWWHAPVIAAGKSIERLWPGDAGYVAGLEFAAPSVPTPRGGNVPRPPEPDTPPDEDPPLQESLCEHIVLSEVLPNPAGTDDRREFIEVHNPSNSAVNLKGCSLRLGETGSVHELPDELLQPGAYRAFYDDETDITLPNGTAQNVWLLKPATQQKVLYLDGMKDDQSWSVIGGVWQVSLPTPGGGNTPLSQSLNPAAVKAEAKNKTAPAQSPCPAGKERNPATNRCRSIVSATSAPAPCKSGQERNPATNRCRSVLSVQTKQKPCPEGQERNVATNRCRKKLNVGAASLAQIQDVNSMPQGANIRWWIAGLVAVSAVGYAAYEWRRDIGNVFYRMKLKYGSKK